MTANQNLVEAVESFQNLLIDRATGSNSPRMEFDYEIGRKYLLEFDFVACRLPGFVRTCRSLPQFWVFIKRTADNYQQRREYLWSQFEPVLDFLENRREDPAAQTASDCLKDLSVVSVHEFWRKAVERRDQDPEGAITAARSLIESVCKTILEDTGVSYEQNADLPRLYRSVAQQLRLGPSQHSEQVFKQILGGCQSVVEGLGAVRNRLGDAHGGGLRAVKPHPRHASLAVNLAGTMATFLVETWTARKGEAT